MGAVRRGAGTGTGARVLLAVSLVAACLVAACDRGPPVAPEPVAPEQRAPHETTAPLAAPTSLPVAAPPVEPATPAPAPPPEWRDESGKLIVPAHWLPGPARRGQPGRAPAERLALDEGCRRCHAQAAHEWSASQHAGAWASDAFQRAFTLEPRGFCQRCHAPEQDAAADVGEVSPAAAALGVGCVTCHVEPGTDVVWAAPRPDPDDPPAPHPLARAPAFGGPQACAACHEFPFPDGALRERPLPMQSTITEHARSAAADRSCADCHMPRDADGDRSHAFPGAYDHAMLARALTIEATRPDAATVRITLRPADVGHAVPTGDLLRRLLVEVVVDGPDGTAAYTGRRTLGRRYGPLHQGNGITVRGELGDERVGMGPAGGVQAPTFTVPAALADQPARWRVVHQRVAQHSHNPQRAPIEGEVEIAAGVLPAP